MTEVDGMSLIARDEIIEAACRVLDAGWYEGKDHEPEGAATWDEAEAVLRPTLDQLAGAVKALERIESSAKSYQDGRCFMDPKDVRRMAREAIDRLGGQ